MSILKVVMVSLASIIMLACDSAPPLAPDPESAKFAELEGSAELSAGLIDLYRIKTTGELYMRLAPNQLNREFLHLATFQDGIAAVGSMRGYHAGKRVIRFVRDYDKLRIEQINTTAYFDPASALSRSAAANLNPAVLAIASITDENEAGDLLVKVNGIFTSEALHQIVQPADPKAEPGSEFKLGELSADKTRVREVNVYPENLDITVDYVYEDSAPLLEGGESLADDRYVSVVLQHSIVALPSNEFQPRFEDPRLGYFTDRATDKTSFSATPYRDAIQRWNLVKENPGAAVSDPIEPITYWLENTTPYEYRDVIREALLTWNQAFESAGFSNAIAVKIQPDDAEWSAADIRYNVLRWTSSDESPWGGYGPRFSDPRTGQIIGSDIMLEFGWLTSHQRRDKLFGQALTAQLAGSDYSGNDCGYGEFKKSQLSLARAMGGHDSNDSALVRQSIFDLITHEVGHSLGLNHNFRGSYFLTPEQLSSSQATAEFGVSASVMDYPSINFAGPGQAQVNYYPLKPGPYDHWAITYGYSEALSDVAAEKLRLQILLNRSAEPGLAFGLDTDDMRYSDSGIDPRVMVFDQSNDPVRYARTRIALVEQAGQRLLETYSAANTSWQEFYDAYLSLTFEWSRQVMVASRWIGGVYVDRSFQQQPGAGVPLQPVELGRQKAAMTLLADKLFAPAALEFDAAVYQHLQVQRRGFNLWKKAQDPKIHDRILEIQKGVLTHLLHPSTLSRISDSELYGNAYPLVDMLSDVSDSIFRADLKTAVNTRRQQLQREYIEQLLRIVDAETGVAYGHLSHAAALMQLLSIEAQLQNRSAANVTTQAHTATLLLRMEHGLNRDL